MVHCGLAGVQTSFISHFLHGIIRTEVRSPCLLLIELSKGIWRNTSNLQKVLKESTYSTALGSGTIFMTVK